MLGGIGCAPDNGGRERVSVGVDSGCFFSGSGAHVSIGRWSEGSISRPSYVMIFFGSSSKKSGDGLAPSLDETRLGFNASYESGPKGISDFLL